MITKADIKQETNSVSYNRGKKIYEEQKVHAFQVQEMEDIFGYQLHKITAVVDGSGKNMYCVSVSVDEEMSEIGAASSCCRREKRNGRIPGRT